MSLASAYAVAIAAETVEMSAVEATVPAGFQGTLISMTVTRDGGLELVAGGIAYKAPAAAALAVGTWLVATFG